MGSPTMRDANGNLICWIPGCMNPEAINFNVNATFDDGSCDLGYGCMNPRAINYKEYAIKGCEAEGAPAGCASCQIGGCMEANMTNYDPEATFSDKSCFFIPTVITGCTDPRAVNWNQEATVDDGECIILGCTNVNATNYDKQATTDDNSCFYDRTGEVTAAIDDLQKANLAAQERTTQAVAGSGLLTTLFIGIPIMMIGTCIMCGAVRSP